jgi:hypothetical protein
MQFDHRETADRHARPAAEKIVEFLRTRFRQIALGQGAGVDVDGAAQRCSRSCRINTSLGTFSFGILARSAAREGILLRVRAGKIRTSGRPLRVTTISPSSATISSRRVSADLISRMLRVFTALVSGQLGDTSIR